MSSTPSLSIMLSNSNSGSLYRFLRSLSKLLFFLSWWVGFWCWWFAWGWLECWFWDCWPWFCAWDVLGLLLGVCGFCGPEGLLSFFGGCPFESTFPTVGSASGARSVVSVRGALASGASALGARSLLGFGPVFSFWGFGDDGSAGRAELSATTFGLAACRSRI